MEIEKVDMYILTNQKYFPSEKIMYLKEKLIATEDRKFNLLATIELKDPMVILLISIFLGYLGIDRFMIGDTGMGVLKLLTCGLCGVLAIIDWFTISDKVKENNFNRVVSIL